MRIISQDGCYDIPYESIILQRLGTTIFGVTTGLQESVTIARYRKEEKAIKAMEMCRRYYDNRSSVTEPKIFQFPVDKEVRV